MHSRSACFNVKFANEQQKLSPPADYTNTTKHTESVYRTPVTTYNLPVCPRKTNLSTKPRLRPRTITRR